MKDAENPFDRYDLDPSSGPQAITERFRELVADAKDEPSREALRAAWDELTLHPEGRVRAAFFAHPETRPPLGEPPRRRRHAVADVPVLALEGLLVLPELSVLLPDAGASATALPFPIDLSDPALTEK
jgi:hypothetical protein